MTTDNSTQKSTQKSTQTTTKPAHENPATGTQQISKTADSAMNEVANETKGRHSNGNRFSGTTAKGGGAERGGPGQDKAAERQPPDSET